MGRRPGQRVGTRPVESEARAVDPLRTRKSAGLLSIVADAVRIVATARTVLQLDLSDPRVAKALELSALVALKRALAAELAEVVSRSAAVL